VYKRQVYITTHVEPWEDSASWDQERVGGLTSSNYDDALEELAQAGDPASDVPPAS
jgi:hypothetical protein